jgi:hypothetical protein
MVAVTVLVAVLVLAQPHGSWFWSPAGEVASAASANETALGAATMDDPRPDVVAPLVSAAPESTDAANTPTDDPVRETPEEQNRLAATQFPRLILNYASDGSDCIGAVFGDGHTLAQSRVAEANDFGTLALQNLCSFALALSADAMNEAEVLVPEVLRPFVLSSDWQARIQLAPGESVEFRLTSIMPDRLEAHWLVLAGDGSETTISSVWD